MLLCCLDLTLLQCVPSIIQHDPVVYYYALWRLRLAEPFFKLSVAVISRKHSTFGLPKDISTSGSIEGRKAQLMPTGDLRLLLLLQPSGANLSHIIVKTQPRMIDSKAPGEQYNSASMRIEMSLLSHSPPLVASILFPTHYPFQTLRTSPSVTRRLDGKKCE